MGCVLSEAQEMLLLKRFPAALLMLDGNQAGREASRVIVGQAVEELLGRAKWS